MTGQETEPTENRINALSLEEKRRRLLNLPLPPGPLAIAYSGGVDSTFLAWFAKEKLQRPVSLFFANSPLIPQRERTDALQTAQRLGLKIEEIDINPLDSVALRNNPTDRCYYCKKEVFSRILDRAEQACIKVIADGSHAGDVGYRPGKRALLELGVFSPLALAGLDKEDIRVLSREAGIPNWDKPSQSCLATRVPYGAHLTTELLARIEKAEDYLIELGCAQVRVRIHGDLARIEAAPTDFPILIASDAREEVINRLGTLGFARVTLDLAGFRSGSWDK